MKNIPERSDNDNSLWYEIVGPSPTTVPHCEFLFHHFCFSWASENIKIVRYIRIIQSRYKSTLYLINHRLIQALPSFPLSLNRKTAMLIGSLNPLPFEVAIPNPLPEAPPFKFLPPLMVLHGYCWFSNSFVGESTG